MKKLYSVESNCCGAAILWNVTTDDEQTGLCTDCKEWATVIKLDENGNEIPLTGGQNVNV
jgi:hypothetical protein|tara:strand:- start:350 stop:529 length:180 start_codon:yes stop_codon:yes gene_type:complete